MYEWDESKSERNLRLRGFDFEFASQVFEGNMVEWADRRRDYGEHRYVAVGKIEGDIFTVIYTWRSEARRIISARYANRRERDAYYQAYGGTDS